MKQVSLFCFSIALLTLGTCVGIHADSPLPNDQTASVAISQQYAQINDAITKHDVDKIMSYFTDDFTEVNVSGAIVNRDQERKDYTSKLSTIKSMVIHYSIDDCNSSPFGTYCDVKFHIEGVGFKKILFMKIVGTFTNDLVVRDFWIATPDGPRLKSRQTFVDETKVFAG